MRVSAARFSSAAILQAVSLSTDLVINCATLFPRGRTTLLPLFLLQEFFLLASLALLAVTLLSTYLLRGMREGCLFSLCTSIVYLALTVCVHFTWPMSAEGAKISAPASIASLTLLAVHRCLAPIYYSLTKRATLAAADPRLYTTVLHILVPALCLCLLCVCLDHRLWFL